LSSVEVTSIPGQVKAQFFDSNFGQSGNDPIRPGPEDIVLTYPVDAWGDPVEYYATNPKPYPPGAMPPVLDATPAGAARLAFSQMAIGRNNGRPFLVSYGQDGPDQLAGSMPVTLISDWNMGMPAAIDHPYNNDNVYSEPDLKDKLRQP
jgi:hypothetical protein